MEVEKLKKEDFASDKPARGTPQIRFTKNGTVIINRSAVRHLGLQRGVSICKDKKDCGEFAIMRDDNGWTVRKAGNGQMVFNNAALVHHILDKTFEKCCHAAGVSRPDSYTFRIALLPLDDDKNKDVFALLRNNENNHKH